MEKPKTIAVPDGVRQEIEALVSKFRDREKSYEDSGYQEESVRVEFINPFFKALGWDVENKANLPETLKPVVHIYSQRLARTTVRPDYAFRYGREKKFLLEAKKPAVDIFLEKKPAYQARIYSFNEKLPIAILTNFKQFAVYDYRITKERPSPEDKPEKGRREFFTFEQYLDNLEFLYSTFSYEAAKQLNFDLYVEEAPTKISREVDEDFLLNLESWRKTLAQDIAKKNLRLSVHEINFAVQVTIDRIIFLRMAEDRGIELPNQLQSLINGTNVYPRLLQVFYRCDDKYNSGLFDFKDDQISTKLKVDDKALAKIIDSLYGEDCPYLFSQWDADVLGSVYERFLGKVIHLTATHQARVEDKPEVKKAKGVYYTPKYIVEYIVKNTVDKRIEGKAPKEISQVKILDPACGSGSFLVQAYQHLLDYHLEWYAKNDPEKNERDGKILRGPDNATLLTIKEKKKILLNNIFGVDIDPQAVEVTKLSLLLKVLEDEDQESIAFQQKLWRERSLPDLDNNIKCGNSLIANDFYKNQQMDFFDEEQKYQINAFDWEQEFKDIFHHRDTEDTEKKVTSSRGTDTLVSHKAGFDVVIGNPPYGAEFEEFTGDYLKDHFATYVWRGESYVIFVEKAIRNCRAGGYFGFIIPDTYLNLTFTKPLRAFLLQNTSIREIVQLPNSVFPNSTVDTTLLFVNRTSRSHEHQESKVKIKIFSKKADNFLLDNPNRVFEVGTTDSFDDQSFNIQANPDELRVLKKIEQSARKLNYYAEMFYGIKAYQVGKGKPPQTANIRDSKPFTSPTKKNSSFAAFFDGRHICRYQLLWNKDNWINYGPWLAEPRNPKKYEGEKLLIRKIVGKTLIATYFTYTSYCNTLLYALKLLPDSDVSYKFILGVLNSNAVGWYFRNKFQISSEDTFPQIMINDILQIPIPTIDISKLNCKSAHDKMIGLVDRILNGNAKLPSAKTPDEKVRLEREIKATDGEIDRLVYELYGLTAEEIAIVEGR